ncbi:MAG: hypothetical protein ACT4QD_21700 [Acidobacteriota bacterium]
MRVAVIGRAVTLRRAGVRAAACALMLTSAQLLMAQTAPSQAPPDRVRVPTSHANVHMGPSTGQEVLVLVPRDTMLTVLARDKEWIQVRLTPDLRKSGMVLRWYKNEDRGWMHDSTVEFLRPPAGKPRAIAR